MAKTVRIETMSKCTAKELCNIYRSVHANTGEKNSEELWVQVGEESGLTANTARQKIGVIRKDLTEAFFNSNESITDNSSEEEIKDAKNEAKGDATEILPFFPRSGGVGRVGSTDITDCVADLVAEYESSVDEVDESTEDVAAIEADAAADAAAEDVYDDETVLV